MPAYMASCRAKPPITAKPQISSPPTPAFGQPQPTAIRYIWVTLYSMKTTFRLTPREVEYIDLWRTGIHHKQIADSMKITPKTAYNHRDNILKKIERQSMGKALSLAYEHNYISLDTKKPA